MLERIEYVLSHSIKENLVARISEWEGLHCAQAMIDGKPMSGVWYDREGEYEARRQATRKAARRGTPKEKIDPGAFMTPYQLKLAPLPCWEGLPLAKIRQRVAKMVAEIEETGDLSRKKEPVGMDRIRNQDPLTRSVARDPGSHDPDKSKPKKKPLCHAASRDMRERVRLAYRLFGAMYREASLKVKFGDVLGAVFPKGSFPPSLPYVRTGEEFDPLADAGGVALWAGVAS